jgi:eukaryotic-like serine/threonine-protein kinase
MQLGRYEILEPIGLGASSTVFKARDTLIGRIVAIKTLQSGLTDPAWRDRFMAEARIVGQLSHPRIVKLHDVGIDETSGAPYLVMEYVVGETLEKYLAARKPQLQQALAWGAALARALSYAHQQGIVHGDIKPANIMINQDGRVMVTDFGIARFAAHVSQAGSLRGTPAYLSPEQILGNPTDGRSDLFSLGIVLYQLTTGRRPFESDSLEAVCAQIIRANITPPSKLNPMLPRAFDGIVARCLARNPQDRYADGELVSTALESVAREPQEAPRQKSGPNASAAKILRYAGVAALVLAALSAPIAAVFYRHNLSLPPAPAALYPAPKPPAELPLWRDTQEAETADAEVTSPPELPIRPLEPPKAAPPPKKHARAPEQKGAIAEAAAETTPAPSPGSGSAEKPRASINTAGIPMTIEISAQSSDGTLAVFSDHEMIFSTPLILVTEAVDEPFRTVCKLIAGEHHLSVVLYKADNSLRAEKQGLAELRSGENNLLAIRVVKHSKILLLRGTGLEVTWPSNSSDQHSEHAAKNFSAKAANVEP